MNPDLFGQVGRAYKILSSEPFQVESAIHCQTSVWVGVDLLQGYKFGQPMIPAIHPQIEFQANEVLQPKAKSLW